MSENMRDVCGNKLQTRGLICELLAPHFSSRWALVRLRFFAIAVISALSIIILVSSCILNVFDLPPQTSTDYLRKKGLLSSIAISAVALFVNVVSLKYISPLWIELLFALLMSGSSIWLLVVWVLTRSDLLQSWWPDSQIGSLFTLWAALAVYAMVWSLSFLALLAFAFYYSSTPPYSRDRGFSPESWMYPVGGSIWVRGVCDIPSWPAYALPSDHVPDDVGRIPWGTLRSNNRFWRTSDGHLLPLLMFQPNTELDTDGADSASNSDNRPTAHNEPPNALSVLRGTVVLALLVGFVVYMEKQLFIETYREWWTQPAQTSYGTLTNSGLLGNKYGSAVVLIGLRSSVLPAGADLTSAVNVTATWTSGVNNTAVQSCALVDATHASGVISETHTIVMASCSQKNINLISTVCTDDGSCGNPDMEIILDYDALGINPGTSSYLSASVWIGFVDEPLLIIANSPTTTLVSNTHLIGAYNIYARRVFKSPESYWGAFQGYTTFGLAETVIYGPNPDPTIAARTGTASLLLLQMYDPSLWRIVADTSIHTVLGGLSSLGGIYTAINSIFMLVFGCALIKALGFGSAPVPPADKSRSARGASEKIMAHLGGSDSE